MANTLLHLLHALSGVHKASAASALWVLGRLSSPDGLRACLCSRGAAATFLGRPDAQLAQRVASIRSGLSEPVGQPPPLPRQAAFAASPWTFRACALPHQADQPLPEPETQLPPSPPSCRRRPSPRAVDAVPITPAVLPHGPVAGPSVLPPSHPASDTADAAANVAGAPVNPSEFQEPPRLHSAAIRAALRTLDSVDLSECLSRKVLVLQSPPAFAKGQPLSLFCSPCFASAGIEPCVGGHGRCWTRRCCSVPCLGSLALAAPHVALPPSVCFANLSGATASPLSMLAAGHTFLPKPTARVMASAPEAAPAAVTPSALPSADRRAGPLSAWGSCRRPPAPLRQPLPSFATLSAAVRALRGHALLQFQPESPACLPPGLLLANLRRARKGTGAGPFGRTAECCRAVLDNERTSQLFVRAAQALAQKPNGRVRGIVVSDFLLHVSRSTLLLPSKKLARPSRLVCPRGLALKQLPTPCPMLPSRIRTLLCCLSMALALLTPSAARPCCTLQLWSLGGLPCFPSRPAGRAGRCWPVQLRWALPRLEYAARGLHFPAAHWQPSASVTAFWSGGHRDRSRPPKKNSLCPGHPLK